jgi:hypothetical protein
LTSESTDPQQLARAITDDLKAGKRAALGYESPLFVPADSNPELLGKRRDGERQEETGNKAFTASVGATVLATGIQSLAWVLREIKSLLPDSTASTRWGDFRAGKRRLFVWEAFVSGSEKAYPPSHAGDAAQNDRRDRPDRRCTVGDSEAFRRTFRLRSADFPLAAPAPNH